MGKRCCGCFGSGSSCCGCCCSKRGATVCFSLVGLALAVAVIVPPVYIYAATGDRNFQLLFPVLELSKDALEHVRILQRKAAGAYLDYYATGFVQAIQVGWPYKSVELILKKTT